MPRWKRPRQSFTFEYKLKVIARADEIGNRAAAREFEIDESMIRYWRKKKDVMTKLPKCQRTCCTGIAKFPAFYLVHFSIVIYFKIAVVFLFHGYCLVTPHPYPIRNFYTRPSFLST